MTRFPKFKNTAVLRSFFPSFIHVPEAGTTFSVTAECPSSDSIFHSCFVVDLYSFEATFVRPPFFSSIPFVSVVVIFFFSLVTGFSSFASPRPRRILRSLGVFFRLRSGASCFSSSRVQLFRAFQALVLRPLLLHLIFQGAPQSFVFPCFPFSSFLLILLVMNVSVAWVFSNVYVFFFCLNFMSPFAVWPLKSHVSKTKFPTLLMSTGPQRPLAHRRLRHE